MPSEPLAASPPPGPPPDPLPDALPGLPPVAPPSGKFIVQLFLVPGMIVVVIVCVLLAFNWLFGGPRSPEAFLSRLDDANFEVRKRVALDLAQVLSRDEQLAGNAGFALDLAERADRARAEAAPVEQALAARIASLSPEEAEAERERLKAERFYLQYLCACLGNFRVPAGVPVLRRLAEEDTGVEPVGLSARRRQAVWALADLGQNLRRFDAAKLPDQETVLAGLDLLTATPARADTARELAKQLNDRRAGRAGALGVDSTLAKCATADDPFLRELTALALSFWDGSAAENRRMEDTLLKLAHDDGRGEDRATGEEAAREPGETTSVTKSPGLHVRLNAAAALAHRGSVKTPLDQLEEMLDANRLRELCLVRHPDGAERPDEVFIVQTQLAALQALAKLHEKQPKLDLSGPRAAVEKLAGDANSDVRMQARATQKALAQ
jgi:hypothetical protein